MFCLALAFIQLEPKETTLLQCQADHHAEVYLCYVKQCWSSTQTLILENNLSQKTLNDVNFGTINLFSCWEENICIVAFLCVENCQLCQGVCNSQRNTGAYVLLRA